MKTKWNKFLKLGLVMPISVIGVIASCGNPEFPSLKAKIHFLVNANKQKYP
ncbi:hypothetical protein [Mesomycoplasma ovipneumoniae]|uniref:hypothetical protein n=1 Tax=Mesomycoplasma ovipneumoniae TaxID=29562 RepID=UPI00311C956E